MPSDLIVTKRRGLGWYAAWVLLVVVLLVISFFIGRSDGSAERELLLSEKEILTRQVEEYETQIADLEQKKVMLESSAQVDAQASEEIMDTITTLQQTIDNMETELSFYRGIMAPEKDVKGLQVSSFTLEQAANKQHFRFQLALTQAKEHRIFLKGSVTAVVFGQLNGKNTQHNLLEISNLKSKDLNFTFRYFQHIKGEITLPEGFKAQRIEVTAKTSGRKPQTASKEFPWMNS